MKSEPAENNKKNKKFTWVIDESKCLSEKEVKKLRAHCKKAKTQGLQNNKFVPVRNWFMIELGLNAGLRVEEIASLKHGSLLIDGTRSSILAIGKGQKKRAIWISSAFKKICHTYIGYKKQLGFSTDEESYLLNNAKDFKITKRSLQKFFKQILKNAGLPDHYYIHCLRHTYTTFLLMASNNNYRFAQKQLGHSSIRTTQVYASVIDAVGKRAVEGLYK